MVLYIEDITRWREDMNFMFEWQEQYLTSERSDPEKYKSTWCQVYRNTKPNQAKFCELILHVNTEKITDFDLNHQIQ